MHVAIVQDGPVYFDLQATTARTLSLMDDAAGMGANTIVFGECWLSGYPVWLDICKDVNIWESPSVKKVWEKMYHSSPTINGQEIKSICQKAQNLDMYVILGMNEKLDDGPGQGTIYNTVVIIDPKLGVVNHHRKLVPTYSERLVHGMGDANGLGSVNTPYGKIGSLICWEHWMPLARQAMHDAGEHVHFALWPMVKEMNHVACRHYAFEGRCIVIAVGQVMHVGEMPEELIISDAIELPKNEFVLRGGSAIYNSDGSFLLPQVYDKREIILVKIQPKKVLADRMNLDVSGHYQRSDVLKFTVDRNARIN